MKTTEEIYQTLLAAFAQRAGFTPEADCDLAVRLYAAAAELQALGIQSEWVLDQSFPQTARGMYLTTTPRCVASPGRRPRRRWERSAFLWSGRRLRLCASPPERSA